MLLINETSIAHSTLAYGIKLSGYKFGQAKTFYCLYTTVCTNLRNNCLSKTKSNALATKIQ